MKPDTARVSSIGLITASSYPMKPDTVLSDSRQIKVEESEDLSSISGSSNTSVSVRVPEGNYGSN